MIGFGRFGFTPAQQEGWVLTPAVAVGEYLTPLGLSKKPLWVFMPLAAPDRELALDRRSNADQDCGRSNDFNIGYQHDYPCTQLEPLAIQLIPSVEPVVMSVTYQRPLVGEYVVITGVLAVSVTDLALGGDTVSVFSPLETE